MGAPPMGARLRLRGEVEIGGYPERVRKIFQAMRAYGLILADNGSDMYIQGTVAPRWNDDELNSPFRDLHADHFEVTELGWNPVSGGIGIGNAFGQSQ